LHIAAYRRSWSEAKRLSKSDVTGPGEGPTGTEHGDDAGFVLGRHG
jgi:hypothetical protein